MNQTGALIFQQFFQFYLTLLFGSPQCQEATYPLFPAQSFLQQSVHQCVVLEQPLHPQPQSQPSPQPQPEPEPESEQEPEPEPEPERLLLQELQPQLILELHFWDPQQPQQESRFVEQTHQNQALGFSENINGLKRQLCFQSWARTVDVGAIDCVHSALTLEWKCPSRGLTLSFVDAVLFTLRTETIGDWMSFCLFVLFSYCISLYRYSQWPETVHLLDIYNRNCT